MTKQDNGTFKLDRSEWKKLLGMCTVVVSSWIVAMAGLYIEVKEVHATMDVKFESAERERGEMKQDIRELRGRH